MGTVGQHRDLEMAWGGGTLWGVCGAAFRVGFGMQDEER